MNAHLHGDSQPCSSVRSNRYGTTQHAASVTRVLELRLLEFSGRSLKSESCRAGDSQGSPIRQASGALMQR